MTSQNHFLFLPAQSSLKFHVFPPFNLTCSGGVKVDDEGPSGENISFIGPLSFEFRVLIMLFDLQHIAPVSHGRGKHTRFSLII